MYKKFSIVILTITLIVIVFNFFANSKANSLVLEDGIWIETERDLNQLKVSQDKFIIEKIPGKNLLFFTQVAAHRKNFFFPLTEINNSKPSQYQPLKLAPLLPCALTTRIKNSKLHAELICDDKSQGTLIFTKNNNSLFIDPQLTSNLAEKETNYLKNVAEIEFSNRKIESLKSNIDELSKLTPEDNLQSTIKKFEEKIRDSMGEEKSIDDLEKELTTTRDQIESAKKERRNLIRSSNYGAEVELASRINSVEWQISLNRWNNLIPLETYSNETINEVPTILDNDITTTGQPTIAEGGKGNSWWKEF